MLSALVLDIAQLTRLAARIATPTLSTNIFESVGPRCCTEPCRRGERGASTTTQTRHPQIKASKMVTSEILSVRSGEARRLKWERCKTVVKWK